MARYIRLTNYKCNEKEILPSQFCCVVTKSPFKEIVGEVVQSVAFVLERNK